MGDHVYSEFFVLHRHLGLHHEEHLYDVGRVRGGQDSRNLDDGKDGRVHSHQESFHE